MPDDSPRRVVVAAAALLVLAACGRDATPEQRGSIEGLDGADEALALAIAGEIRDDDDPLSEVLDPDCVGASIVTSLGGADRIAAEYGVTSDAPSTDGIDLRPDDARSVAAGYARCGDLKEVFVAGFSEDDAVTEEQGQCLVRGISSADIEAVFVETLQGITDGPRSNLVFEQMFSRVEVCGIDG